MSHVTRLVLALLVVGLPLAAGCARSASRALTPSAVLAMHDGKPQAFPYPRKLVAPVFEHGEGWCEHGGGHLTSTLNEFIGEQAGLEIIRAELAAVGVAFTEFEVTVYRGPVADPVGAERRKSRTAGRGPWVIDMVDPIRHIAVEYLSRADLDYFGDPRTSWSLGDGDLYLFHRAAKWTARNFHTADVDPKIYAVFYDPVDHDTHALRRQVHDFIAWLRKNEVLRRASS